MPCSTPAFVLILQGNYVGKYSRLFLTPFMERIFDANDQDLVK